jgi:hypothetical protein
LRNFDIVFVPGLRPKPESSVYRVALLRCIRFGLQRAGADDLTVGNELDEAFHLYSWTEEVYGEHRDIGRDQAGIDALLAAPDISPQQREEIDAPSRRLMRAAHRVGDRIPLLGRAFAGPRQRILLREARDYLRNRMGVGKTTREGFSELLERVWSDERPLVIVGHSLGSVIAYDTLWELSRSSSKRVAAFITLGSPLGTRFVRKLIFGADRQGEARYPSNIDRWVNIAARGELTALYPRLGRHFGEMVQLGLLESFEDHVDIYNYFFGERGLNVHSEYAYLIQPAFVAALAEAVGGKRTD